MPQIALWLWGVACMFTREQMFSAQKSQHSFPSREMWPANSSSLGPWSQQSDSQGEMGHSVSLVYLYSGSFYPAVRVPACTAAPPTAPPVLQIHFNGSVTSFYMVCTTL